MLSVMLRLLKRCFNAAAADEADPEVVVHITSVTRGLKHGGSGDKPGGQDCIPQVFAKRYKCVIPHNVATKEAVCITSDVAVLGDARVEGDSCITGNLLVAGSVTAKGSICITGDAIVLANARVEGQVCITGNCAVMGDLAVKGKLDVGGKLCVFGSKDIQPA